MNIVKKTTTVVNGVLLLYHNRVDFTILFLIFYNKETLRGSFPRPERSFITLQVFRGFAFFFLFAPVVIVQFLCGKGDLCD